MTPAESIAPDFQNVLQIERHRLMRDWRRLTEELARHPASAETSRRLAKWRTSFDESAAAVAARQQSVPKLQFDTELPITAHRDQLVDLVRSRQTIVVCGETGSGKSTQLPKICLEAGFGLRGMIGHTQPRRLAARAVASRLADELGTRVGDLVGFKIRFNDTTAGRTLVKIMTDGVLLAETQSDRFLDAYEVIIIDEAHERSLNIDFLLGYLRRLTLKRPDLRIIITSATIDPERFAAHFADDLGPAPIVEVSGRTYPVEVRFRGIAGSMPSSNGAMASPKVDLPQLSFDEEESLRLDAIAQATDELFAEGSGDILVFLATEREIREAAKHLRGHFTRMGILDRVEILPLYARLSHSEQNRIFQSHSKRRIVLATNVAESSLTVPGIRSVIDTGLARISRYAPRTKVQRLPIEPISQASANQRCGRCGRLGPGICIRLFSEDDFLSRPQFTTPEIRRSDLASVLLQSLILRLGSLEEFPLIDPPKSDALRDGQRTLLELGATDEFGRLTDLGLRLGRLPCDPRVARMLIEADQRDCLADVLIIAAAIEIQDVRQRPVGQQPQSDAAHARFKDPHSDFLAFLRLWDFYENLSRQLGRGRLGKVLSQHYLSQQGFREWSEVIRQLKELLVAANIRPGKRLVQLQPIPEEAQEQSRRVPSPQKGRGAPNSQEQSAKAPRFPRPKGYEATHQSLLSGLLSGLAVAGERSEYIGAGGFTFSIWPGSGLFRRTPKWIMVAQTVETSRRYGRIAAEIDVGWVEAMAGPLLKHAYFDPHWSRKAQSAMVYKNSTLYGLPIVQRQRVPLAPVDAKMARELMIEQGLVAGQWNCQERFYKHNQQLIEQLHTLAQRTRRREFLLDPFQSIQFYRQRLPSDVVDLNSLRVWLKRNSGSEQERGLWMTQEDLVPEVSSSQVSGDFPDVIDFGPTRLPLEYRFEPGHAADGVTVTVPQVALRQLDANTLGWPVPGMLEEKLLCMIRALPKDLRVGLLPVPDAASQLAKELRQWRRDVAFPIAACGAMSRHAGHKITPQDVDWSKMPDHLQYVVRVVDDNGTVMEEGRDLQKLQSSLGIDEASFSSSQDIAQEVEHWTDRKITTCDMESIPETFVLRRGNVQVAAYPALVDEGSHVVLRIADKREEAERLSRQGWVRLFALKHARELRSQIAYLPELDRCSVMLASLLPKERLQRTLTDLIVRISLVDDQPRIDGRSAWEARNKRSAVAIPLAVQDIAQWLPKFAAAYHDVRLVLESAPSVWDEVKRDIQQQLDGLLAEGFLSETPWKWLREYPRYLQAAKARWEKLRGGGIPKDRKLSEPIQRIHQALLSALAEIPNPSLEQSRQLNEILWLFDEFRVSIFAQHLGTVQSISEKRLLDLIARTKISADGPKREA